MPNNIKWEKELSGAAFQSYYQDYPCVANYQLPHNESNWHFRTFSLRWSFQQNSEVYKFMVRSEKGGRIHKHKTPLLPITDINYLKASFALFTCNEQRYHPSQVWDYFFPSSYGFNCVITKQWFQQLNCYILFAISDNLDLDSLNRVAKGDKLIEVPPFSWRTAENIKGKFYL